MKVVDAIVIDDQTIFRELLVELLEADPDFVVRGQHDTGREALAHCQRVRPGLVVLDVMLPDMSGLAVLEALRRDVPECAVVVVTAYAKPTVVRDAVELGAHAIVSKGAPLSELREALARARVRGTFYCAETSRVLRDNALNPPPVAELTARQREIVHAVASGLSSKEIAAKLGVSVKTVSNHRMQIMRRLGLRDVASLTRYAIERGLVEGTTG